MKVYKILLLITILFSCVASGIYQDKINLVGEWNGTDYWNNESSLKFTKDSIASFTINDQPFGGKF